MERNGSHESIHPNDKEQRSQIEKKNNWSDSWLMLWIKTKVRKLHEILKFYIEIVPKNIYLSRNFFIYLVLCVCMEAPPLKIESFLKCKICFARLFHGKPRGFRRWPLLQKGDFKKSDFTIMVLGYNKCCCVSTHVDPTEAFVIPHKMGNIQVFKKCFQNNLKTRGCFLLNSSWNCPPCSRVCFMQNKQECGELPCSIVKTVTIGSLCHKLHTSVCGCLCLWGVSA